MEPDAFFTALLSWIIFGESLAGIQSLGMISMVGGEFIVQLGKPAFKKIQESHEE